MVCAKRVIERYWALSRFTVYICKSQIMYGHLTCPQYEGNKPKLIILLLWEYLCRTSLFIS